MADDPDRHANARGQPLHGQQTVPAQAILRHARHLLQHTIELVLAGVPGDQIERRRGERFQQPVQHFWGRRAAPQHEWTALGRSRGVQTRMKGDSAQASSFSIPESGVKGGQISHVHSGTAPIVYPPMVRQRSDVGC